MKKTLFTLFFGLTIVIINAQNTKPINTKTGNIKVVEAKGNTNATNFSPASFTMNFNNKDKKGKTTTGSVDFAFLGTQVCIVPKMTDMKGMKMRNIYDVKSAIITTLFDDNKGKKNGLIMKMPKATLDAANKEIESKNAIKNITKTDEKKIIDGYKCEKTIIEYTDGSKSTIWATNEVILDMKQLSNLMNSGMKGQKNPLNGQYDALKGTPIESEYVSIDGSTVTMKMTNIKKGKPDAALFNTNDYELMDVTKMPMFGK